jgi:branched-chain amino acid transport system permease protein
VAALFAGFAGAIFTFFNRAVTPNLLDWTKSAEPVIMTVIGGQYTFFGPLVGAFIYLFLQSFILDYTIFWPIIIGGILLLVVLFLPGGVLGTIEEWVLKIRRGNAAEGSETQKR